MKNGFKRVAILVFLILCFNQAWAGGGSSPESVVKGFTRAYFMLDESMGDYLSKEARYNEDELDMVDLYLDQKQFDANRRGYKMSYLKMQPVSVKAQTLEMDDSSAKIKCRVQTIRSINPLFRAVGFIFGLLEEHEQTDIITLVKEDGNWKIGPGAYDLPAPVL